MSMDLAPGSPAAPVRSGAITITRSDMDTAVADGVLTADQAGQLWNRFAAQAQSRPRFDAAHVAYYAGAVIVLGAMGWFLTEAWMQLGGAAITVIALAYAGAFWLAGETLWKKGLTTPGGLLFTLAVWMVPLAIYGIEVMTNLWPQDYPGNYRDYYEYVRGGWIVMEIGTIIAGAIAVWARPFPFLTFPIAFALWFMSMDVTPLLFGRSEYGWNEREWVSVVFGLVILLVSYLADLANRVREDFAFWGYLFGLLAFWGGLSVMEGGTEAAKFVYCLINVALVVISVLIRQRSFIVFGALGVLGYLGHLSYTVFEDSLLFPGALTMLGIGLIYLGVIYQRNSQRIAIALQTGLPEGIRNLIPSRARYQ